ncbi:hypothetical protein D9M71_561590 [compost metagenome]
MGAPQLGRILGALDDVIDFGQGIDVKVGTIVDQHRLDAGTPLHFVEVAHIGQVILVVVATNPGQSIIAQGLRGGYRTAGQAQGIDVIGVEVPMGIEHTLRIVTIGTDAGIDLATFGQAQRAYVGLGADVDLDARRLEHLP